MRLALLLTLLGDTSTTSHWGDVEGMVSLRAVVRSSVSVDVDETPLGLVVTGKTLHGHELPQPTVIIPAGTPLLAATGVNVWHEEWLAPGLLLAGSP